MFTWGDRFRGSLYESVGPIDASSARSGLSAGPAQAGTGATKLSYLVVPERPGEFIERFKKGAQPGKPLVRFLFKE